MITEANMRKVIAALWCLTWLLSLTAYAEAPTTYRFTHNFLVSVDLEAMAQMAAAVQMGDVANGRQLVQDQRIINVKKGQEAVIVLEGPLPETVWIFLKGTPGRWLTISKYLEAKK